MKTAWIYIILYLSASLLVGCSTIYDLAEQEFIDQLEGKPDPVPDQPDVVPPGPVSDPVPDAPTKPSEPDCSTPALPGQRVIESMRMLWKPVSESDGRLVTLVDRRVRTHIVSVEVVYKGLVYESGRFVGDTHNGCRPHHRWMHPGGGYAPGCVVLYKIAGVGGTWQASYYVGLPDRRFEWSGPTGIITPDGRIIRQ